MGAFLSIIAYLSSCGRRDAWTLPRHRQDISAPTRQEDAATSQEKQPQKQKQQTQQQGSQQQIEQKQEQQEHQGQKQQKQQQQETGDSDTANNAAVTSSLPPPSPSSSPPISDPSSSSPTYPNPKSKSKRRCKQCPPDMPDDPSSEIALLPITNDDPRSWETHHQAKQTRWMIFVSRYLWSVWQWPRYELETTKLFADEPAWVRQKRVSPRWKAHMDAQLERMLDQPWRLWDPVPFQADPNVNYKLATEVMMHHLGGPI